jgi:hypothetical protein
MSRRSEPTPIGPLWARETAAERRLTATIRPLDGWWACGATPNYRCDRCEMLYDLSEFGACPGCRAYYAFKDRERWAQIAVEQSNDTTH